MTYESKLGYKPGTFWEFDRYLKGKSTRFQRNLAATGEDGRLALFYAWASTTRRRIGEKNKGISQDTYNKLFDYHSITVPNGRFHHLEPFESHTLISTDIVKESKTSNLFPPPTPSTLIFAYAGVNGKDPDATFIRAGLTQLNKLSEEEKKNARLYTFTTKKSFLDAWEDARTWSGKTPNMLKDVYVFSHAAPGTLEFLDNGIASSSLESKEVKDLGQLSYHPNAKLELRGCNTAVDPSKKNNKLMEQRIGVNSIAGAFAASQHIKTIGTPAYSSPSTCEDKHCFFLGEHDKNFPSFLKNSATISDPSSPLYYLASNKGENYSQTGSYSGGLMKTFIGAEAFDDWYFSPKTPLDFKLNNYNFGWDINTNKEVYYGKWSKFFQP